MGVAGRSHSPSDLPRTMKAVAIDRFGPPEVLTLHALPVPEPGPNEILIQVYGAGVGIWDAKMRDSTWWPGVPPKFPVVLGTDGAGIVVARGARVRRFEEGDRVWAYEYVNPRGGFYAEYVAIDAQHAGTAPRSLDLLHAGAAAVTGLTALQGIDDHLRVRAKDAVLIFGASGAVGTLAIKFAKLRNARVIGMARGSDALALVRKLGADEAIDANSDDAPETLNTMSPNGLDAVLALAGGEMLERCLDLVRSGGHVAFPNGVEPEPRPRKGVRVQGYDAIAEPQNFANLENAVEQAHLQVPIAEVYPLWQAAKAHQRIEQGHVLGRIALNIRSEK